MLPGFSSRFKINSAPCPEQARVTRTFRMFFEITCELCPANLGVNKPNS